MSNDHVGGHHCTICDYRFEGFKIPPPPPPPPRPERELAWEEVMRTARDENEKMFGVV